MRDEGDVKRNVGRGKQDLVRCVSRTLRDLQGPCKTDGDHPHSIPIPGIGASLCPNGNSALWISLLRAYSSAISLPDLIEG